MNITFHFESNQNNDCKIDQSERSPDGRDNLPGRTPIQKIGAKIESVSKL